MPLSIPYNGSQALITAGTTTNGKPVIVKQYSTLHQNQYIRETSILQLLQGKRNIVPMLNSSPKHSAFVMPQYDCDLFTHVFVHQQPVDYKQVFHEIGRGIFECHKKGIAHLDVKPENILIETSTNKYYICDFGLSVLSPPGKRGVMQNIGLVGTTEYRAPEITVSPNSFDPFAADIYSLGCLFFCVLTSFFPDFDTNGAIMFPSENRSIRPDMKRIITSMTNPIPLERPSIEEVLQDPAFSKQSMFRSLVKKAKQIAG